MCIRDRIDTIKRIFSYAVAEDPENNIDGVHIYKINTNGEATLLQTDIFNDGEPSTLSAGDVVADNISGKIFFREAAREDGSNILRVRVFDVKSETITGWQTISGLGDSANPVFIAMPDISSEKIEKKCTSSDGSTCAISDPKSISLGGGDMEVVIDLSLIHI